MKYLRKFNESIEEQIYNQVLDTIKECFLEFEDNGWYWTKDEFTPDISIRDFPKFNCRMIPKEDEYVPSGLRDSLDWTGEINSDGEITWATKELEGYNPMTEQREEFKEGSKEREEAEDFLTTVERLQSEIGIGFKFSYNNRGGEKRIIIQGRI